MCKKILESEVIGLDRSIKRTFNNYLDSLKLNEQSELMESEQSVAYMEQLKHLKAVFFNAYDELVLYLNGERLRQFMVNHQIGLSASSFQRAHNMGHENDWEVLKYIHCLAKYFSDKRYFVRSDNEEAKQFAIIFVTCDFHVVIAASEEETMDYMRAYKRYYEHVHMAE